MSCVLSTTVPFGFDFDTRRFIDAYKDVGCVSGQFYRNTLAPPTVAEIVAMANEADFPMDSMHGVFGWRYDPSSPDASHRQFCLETYESEGRLALEIGEPMVVVHPSANRADFTPYTPEEAALLQETRWPHLEDFMPRLAEIGERLGVTYLIENVPYLFPLGHHAGALAERILNVQSDRLRMCFDTGHANITGNTAEDLRVCADAVSYVHVNDNDGVSDTHLMPGDGCIDWAAFADAVRESGLEVPMMLEVFYPEAKVESMRDSGLGERLSAACATVAPA